MRTIAKFFLLSGFVAGSLTAVARGQAERQPLIAHRPVHTYSIVARDPNTGELGVAVQSHWFSVGPIVAWAEAGVGAVATQRLSIPVMASLVLI